MPAAGVRTEGIFLPSFARETGARLSVTGSTLGFFLSRKENSGCSMGRWTAQGSYEAAPDWTRSFLTCSPPYAMARRRSYSRPETFAFLRLPSSSTSERRLREGTAGTAERAARIWSTLRGLWRDWTVLRMAASPAVSTAKSWSEGFSAMTPLRSVRVWGVCGE